MRFLKKQYHWLVALIVLLQLFILGGFFNNSIALFLLPVTEDMGISRTAFSLAVGCRGVVAFLVALVSGTALTKLGFRKCSGILLLQGAVALVLMATSKSPVVYGIGMGMLGLADGICISTGPARIIRSWFHKHQGAVLGTVSAFTGIGGSILAILLTAVISISSWRTAQLVCAGIMGTVAVLTLLFVRDRPEDIKLKPFGEGQYDHKEKKPKQQWAGFSFRELLRKPGFYLLILLTLLSNLLGYSMMHAMVPHYQDSGLTPDQATSLQSIFLLVLASAKLVLGLISDKAGPKWAAVTCLICIIVSLVLMAVVNSYAIAFVSVFTLGFSLAHTTITVPLLVPNLFGSRAQATSVGIFTAVVSLASMTSAPFINTVYDKIGTYRPIYQIGIWIMAAIIGLYLLLFWMSSRDKKKMESAAAVTDKT